MGDMMKQIGGMLGETGPEATKGKWSQAWGSTQGPMEQRKALGQGLPGLKGMISLQQGGRVPGYPGQPQVAMVHGGEQVIPNRPKDPWARPGGRPGIGIPMPTPPPGGGAGWRRMPRPGPIGPVPKPMPSPRGWGRAPMPPGGRSMPLPSPRGWGRAPMPRPGGWLGRPRPPMPRPGGWLGRLRPPMARQRPRRAPRPTPYGRTPIWDEFNIGGRMYGEGY